MRVMGMEAVAPKRRTSLPDDKHHTPSLPVAQPHLPPRVFTGVFKEYKAATLAVICEDGQLENA